MNNLIGREKGIECTIRWNIDKNYSSSLSTVFIFKFQKNQNRKIPRFKTQFPPDCPFNRLIQSNRPIVSTSTLDRLDSPSLVCLSICHLSLIYSRFEKTQKFVINSTPRHRSTLYINTRTHTHTHIYIENVHNGDVGSIVPAHPHRAPLCRPWPAVQTGICQNQLTTNSFAMLVCHCHRFTAICHPNLMNIHRDPIDPPSFDSSFVGGWKTRGIENRFFVSFSLSPFFSIHRIKGVVSSTKCI